MDRHRALDGYQQPGRDPFLEAGGYLVSHKQDHAMFLQSLAHRFGRRVERLGDPTVIQRQGSCPSQRDHRHHAQIAGCWKPRPAPVSDGPGCKLITSPQGSIAPNLLLAEPYLVSRADLHPRFGQKLAHSGGMGADLVGPAICLQVYRSSPLHLNHHARLERRLQVRRDAILRV